MKNNAHVAKAARRAALASSTFHKLLTVLFALLMVFRQEAYADPVILGSEDTDDPSYSGLYPAYAFSSGESVFSADEIGTTGMIRSFALNKVTDVTGTAVDSVYIYMKESSSALVPGTSSLAGYTCVYKGDFPDTVASGWVSVPLSTPFAYTGSGELHVLIVRHNGTAMTTDYPAYYSSYDGWRGLNYYSGDTDYWSGWGTAGAVAMDLDYTTDYRPQIMLDISPFPPCSGKPVAGTPRASADGTCAGAPVTFSLSGSSAVTGLSYSWDTSATGTGGWATAGIGTEPAGSWSYVPDRALYYRCRVACGTSEDTSAILLPSLVLPRSIPYSEDFESGEVGENLPCAANTNDFGNSDVWNLMVTPFELFLPAIVNHTPGGSNYLMAGSWLGDYESGQPEYWFTPGLALKGGKSYEVSFWFNGSGRTSGITLLNVLAGTEQDAGAMTLSTGLDTAVNTTTYTQLVRRFSVPATGTWYVGIKVNHTTRNYPGIVIDDINVEELPSCSSSPVAGRAVASPGMLCSEESVSVLSLTGTSAMSDLEYQWQQSATGLPGSWTNAPGAATSVTYTTLVPAAALYYRCYVRCPSAGLPDTSAAVFVSTAPFPLPYVEDFESGEMGRNQPCAANTNTFGSNDRWNLLTEPLELLDNHTPGGKKYLTAGYELGTDAFRGQPEYWFTPGLALRAGKSYEVSFWFNGSGYDGGNTFLNVVAGPDQDVSSMTLATGPDTAVNTTEYTRMVRRFSVSSSGTYYVGIKVNHNKYSYPGIAIDDIRVAELPSCSGRPVAGRAVASPGMLCSEGAAAVLSLTGTSAVSDLLYQWQQSATGLPGSWTNAPGDSSGVTYRTKTPVRAGYYRCYVSCPAVRLTDTSAPVYVSTAPLSLPYLEDFESGEPGRNQPCAANTNTFGSDDRWNLLAAPLDLLDNHTPAGSKYLIAGYNLGAYNFGGSPDYWFTPGLAMTGGKNYEVSFWFNGSGYPAGRVWLNIAAGTAQNVSSMTLGTGPDTMVNTTTYTQLRRHFTVPASGTWYVGIKVNNTTYNSPGIAIDDINIKEMPTCSSRPVAGKVLPNPGLLCAATEQSVLSLTGTSAVSDLAYRWQQSVSGMSGSWTDAPGDSSGITYRTKTPATALYYRCYVSCPSLGLTDTSAAVYLGTTPVRIPYFEDFESGTDGKNQPCATNTNSFGTMENWNLMTTPRDVLDNHSPGGSKYLLAGLYLGTGSSGRAEYWFTPALALTGGKNYKVSFWFNGSGRKGGNMLLNVAAGPGQDAASMTIGTGPDTAINTTTYTQLVRNFTAPVTGSYYVGIKVNHTVYNYPGVAIDDISIEEMPGCSSRPVAGIAVASPGMLCAEDQVSVLSLSGTTAVSGLAFRWQQSPSGLPGSWTDAPGDGAKPAYTTAPPATAMYYRCSVGCPLAGLSDTSVPAYVSTTPLRLPYSEDFESGVTGKNQACAGNTNTFGSNDRWNLMTAPFALLDNHSPGGSKYLIAGTNLGIASWSGRAEYWFTPGLALNSGKNYEVSFWFNGSGRRGGNVLLNVVAGPGQDAASMTIGTGPDMSVNTTTYKQLRRNFSAPLTGTYYVGIKVNHTVYNYPGLAIDDINVSELPSCSSRPVAGLVAASPGLLCGEDEVAVLSLSGTSAASDLAYQWQQSATGLPGSWADAPGNDTSTTYTTLTPATSLYYRCYISCPSVRLADTSASVYVQAAPMRLPYSEDFESGTMGKNQPCAGNTNTFGSNDKWNLLTAPFEILGNHSPGGSKYLIGGNELGIASWGGKEEYWFTPGLALNSGKNYEVSFWLNGSGNRSGNVLVNVAAGTSQDDRAMTIGTGPDTSVNTTTYIRLIRHFTAPAPGTYYVGIKVNHTTYNYPGIAIDDINISESPSCSSSPVAGRVTASQSMLCSDGSVSVLSLAGTSAVSDLEYQWQASATGLPGSWTDAPGDATGVTYTTTVPAVAGYYRCYVRCGPAGLPDTSAAVYLAKAPLIPPYLETFESGTVGTNLPCAANTNTFGRSNFWNLLDAPYGDDAPALVNHTPGGNKYLLAGSDLGFVSSGPAEYWFSPAITLKAGETYEGSFWYNGTAQMGGYSRLGMYLGNAQDKAAMTTVVIADRTVNTNAYSQLTGRFTVAAAGNYYLGIKVNHLSNSGSGLAIDDIGLVQLPLCSGVPVTGPVSALPAVLCSPGKAKLAMDLGGVSKVADLTYRWEWTTIDPSSAFIVSGSGPATGSPLFTSAKLNATTWFRCIVRCSLTGDSAISAIQKVDIGVIVPPYIETFESGTEGVNMPCAAHSGTWGLGSWFLFGIPLGPEFPSVDNHTPGGNKFLLAGSDVTTPAFWFSPAIRLNPGKLYQLSFWYNGNGSVSEASVLGAYYGTAQTESAMTAISPDRNVRTFVYKQYSGRFTAPVSGNYYIGIKVLNPGAGMGVSIDDIGLQEVPECTATVTAGRILSEPSRICDAGAGGVLDLEGSTLAKGLTYQWLSATDPAGPYTASGSGLPFNTPSLFRNTWFKAVVHCPGSGARDTSAAFLLQVGTRELPYVETFESTPVGDVPLCSDATRWADDYYFGWRVQSRDPYPNHTPGGRKYLVAGASLGSPDEPSMDHYWFTPGFQFRAGYKYRLSFWYIGSQYGDPSKMGVYYGTAQSAGAMSHVIAPFRDVNNRGYAYFDTVFTSAGSGVSYLGFRKSGADLSFFSYDGVAFDDISLDYAPCDGSPAAGAIESIHAPGKALCKGTHVSLRNTGATIKQVSGIQYRWQRRPAGSALSWDNIAGAEDSVYSSDTLVGWEYRMQVICTHTNDTVVTGAYQLPEAAPHPAVSILPATASIVYCHGDTVHLLATSYRGASYDWIRDDTVVPGWKFEDLGATKPGLYRVRVSSPASVCVGYSDTVRLIAANPDFEVILGKPRDSITCADKPVTLSAATVATGVSFQWRKDNLDIPGATGDRFLVKESGTYSVAAYRSGSACPALSRTIRFTVHKLPEAKISTSGLLTGCENEGVDLVAGGGAFYQWSRSGSEIVGWVDSVVTVKISGRYTVKVTSANGCAGISESVTVNILPSPAPIIVKSGLRLSTTMSYKSYKWTRNGSATGETTAFIDLTKMGSYTVIVEDENGCFAESAPILVMDDGLGVPHNPDPAPEILVFPNPTDAKVFISAPVPVNVRVQDITGKTVYEQSRVTSVDLANLADGLYLFLISNPEGVVLKQTKVNKITR